MATQTASDHNAARTEKDPLATHLIPEIIEDRKHESEGRILSFRRGKLLGKGGFAKVFATTLLPGKAPYAVKIVAKSSLQKERAKQKFITEIKIHKALRHVNVVKFERCFEDNSFFFIVMELCDYNSMSELIKRRKKLSEPETRYYLAQIVESLQYLHRNLVIHRDLKLGNLFIDSSMRIKVGDFGLATHLTSPDERRKTICGTPNYIAPEILEGKTGHSFEVDIWSTGVILYTLLVGKPPFESKDVKSTYKRILANSYAFPEHTPVSADAKNLIRKMLQANPEHRPKLGQIAAHPFFTRPTAYMPTTLPESALHECPRLVQMNDFVQSSAAYNFKEEALHENYFAVKGHEEAPVHKPNNENDPAAMNRMNVQAVDQHALRKEGGGLGDGARLRSSAGLKSTAPGGLSGSTASAANPSSGSQMLSSTRSSTVRSQSTAPFASAAAVYSTKSATSTATAVAYGAPAVDRTKQNPYSAAASSAAVRPSSSSSRGYGQKFDIYVDVKPPAVVQTTHMPTGAPSSGSLQQAGRKRDASDAVPMDVDMGLVTERRGAARGKGLVGDALPSTVPSRLTTADRKPQYEFEIDKINTDFEQVQIAESRNRLAAAMERPAVSTPTGAASAKQAWAWNENQDVFPPSQAVNPPVVSRHVSTPAMATAATMEQQPAPAAESEAMCISTPQDQVVSHKECKPLGTLETMHEMLNNSFSVVESGVTGLAGRARWSGDTGVGARPDASPVAKVWVVRYVDYTSKYGLGFLFNTGSAGVYFNDSTKIVLSADGKVFQYTERRRGDSANGSEHTSQKHLITCYPQELQKKVTLLKHFRNYLIDQEKNSAARPGEGDTGNPGLIRDGVSSDGASAAVRFGHSSTRYNAVEENDPQWRGSRAGPPGSPMATDDEEDLEMPFLKKWVRTKHAILFRISNRTVQVVFYDRSEVLLSSEARVITYVSKQGQRSEHSLDEVLQTGRVDIAKRLKYTKDIMFRLINTQLK